MVFIRYGERVRREKASDDDATNDFAARDVLCRWDRGRPEGRRRGLAARSSTPTRGPPDHTPDIGWSGRLVLLALVVILAPSAFGWLLV